MGLRALARGTGDPVVCTGDSGRGEAPAGGVVKCLEDGNIVDQARVLTHPDLYSYTYPFPPDITRNLIDDIAVKTDANVVRTVGSNVLVQRAQLDEDVIITEVWLGSDNLASTVAEMARVFHLFWNTPLAVGDSLGWEPRDRTTRKYKVRIVSVQIGGADYEYREVRPSRLNREDALITSQFTVQFKIERPEVPAAASITLEGI
jgi:hypothetical protein